ncbi:MAG: hypothetical protein ABI446_05115 [Gemmatimonadaceae bacterium]
MVIAAAAVATGAKCGGDSSTRTSAADSAAIPKATHAAAVPFQIPKGDPCSWISRADAQTALGDSIIAAPTRVRSADNAVAQQNGLACLFELPPHGSIAQHVAIQVTPDESGAMEFAFAGMGNVESELTSSRAKRDTLIDGRWDFMSAIPGGLTALRAGRVAMQVVTPPGRVEPGMKLAAAMLDHIADLPFAGDSADPLTAPYHADPCALLTRAEAEGVLGKLTVAPYPSSHNTALVYGGGNSCSYYSSKHRALVITPRLRGAADMYKMMGGVNAQVAAKTGASSQQGQDTLEGNWDALSIGSDGALLALKGDKMLTVQYRTSGATFDETVKLVRAALARL